MQTSGTFGGLSDGVRKTVAGPPRFKSPGSTVGRAPKAPVSREPGRKPMTPRQESPAPHRRGGFADRKGGK